MTGGFYSPTFDPVAFDAGGGVFAVAADLRYPQPQVDDALWQILAGDDTNGWRDITDECGGLVYSTVMPGGPASASFTLPADVWGLGYNGTNTVTTSANVTY